MLKAKTNSLIVFSVILLLLTSDSTKAQVDTSRIVKVRRWPESMDVQWGCIRFGNVNNKEFKTDSIYNRLFLQDSRINVLNEVQFIPDDDVLDLLDKYVSDTNSNVCLLPLLQILDSSAAMRYDRNCRTVPYYIEERLYCNEPSLQYFTLYFLEFIVIRKGELKHANAIENIQLVKKDSKKNSKLNNSEYQEVYSLYRKYFEEKKKKLRKVNKDVLRSSKYEWIISHY